MKFSERYGYVKPEEAIIRDQITPEIQNAMCNCLHFFSEQLRSDYSKIKLYIWGYFLNQRIDLFDSKSDVIKNYIQNDKIEWFKKLDLIEKVIEKSYISGKTDTVHTFTQQLNSEFERLNFAYRIVENQIVEITSEQEIKTIETAIESNKDNIRLHLNNALKLYAQRPNADYRNSIKESITAVEAFTREITGEKNLNFKRMEEGGIIIPSLLRQSFEKLYGYTNDSTTGIRHALMDDAAEYVPRAEEALFMLVSCSAFINYLNSKKTLF